MTSTLTGSIETNGAAVVSQHPSTTTCRVNNCLGFQGTCLYSIWILVPPLSVFSLFSLYYASPKQVQQHSFSLYPWGFGQVLCELFIVNFLPPPQYSEDQWIHFVCGAHSMEKEHLSNSSATCPYSPKHCCWPFQQFLKGLSVSKTIHFKVYVLSKESTTLFLQRAHVNDD